jgi:hypothetical protein
MKPINTKYSVTDCCSKWCIYLPPRFTGLGGSLLSLHYNTTVTKTRLACHCRKRFHLSRRGRYITNISTAVCLLLNSATAGFNKRWVTHTVWVSITSLSVRMIKGQTGEGPHARCPWGQRALNPHLLTRTRNQSAGHSQQHLLAITSHTSHAGTSSSNGNRLACSLSPCVPEMPHHRPGKRGMHLRPK